MSAKVISLQKARLARLTTQEKAERRRQQRAYRVAIACNEAFEKQHVAALKATAIEKIKNQIVLDVLLSFPDPTTAAVGEVTRRVEAAMNRLKEFDVLDAAISRAADALHQERPDLWTYPQVFVPPRPL